MEKPGPFKQQKSYREYKPVSSRILQTVFGRFIFGTDEEYPYSGDIVLVKIGDIIPADCRILPEFLSGLEVDEALLTGESLPVQKTGEPIEDPICPVGDRTSMVYSGSQVTKGRARVVCVATGMNTELGKIQEAMGRKEKNTKVGWARTWHKIKVFLGVAETTPLQVK
jgi:Na+-exporting ATPase